MLVRASVTEKMGTIETAAETNGRCHNSTITGARAVAYIIQGSE